MNRQLRVTDDICEQHMRDLELNFLFNLGSHVDSRGNAGDKYTIKSILPIVEREGRSRNRSRRRSFSPRTLLKWPNFPNAGPRGRKGILQGTSTFSIQTAWQMQGC